MNKALKEELKTYFYNDASRIDLPKVVNQTSNTLNQIKKIAKDSKQYWLLEDEVLQSCTCHELQGFLNGYDYCLLMMGNHQ